MPPAPKSSRVRSVSGALSVGERQTGWLLTGALDGRPLVLLAHGAGAPYTSDFMEATAAGLVNRGLDVARFHFPYMQRRLEDRARRPPDRMPVLLDCWRAMIDEATSWAGAGPIVLAGKSMGGRAASMLLAEGRGEPARGAVYLGYPLHAPGKTDKLRSEHLTAVPVPQLFVSGTRDRLARRELLEPVVEALGGGARLHLVEGGDHSLATSRKRPLAGAEAWLDVVAAFVEEACTS